MAETASEVRERLMQAAVWIAKPFDVHATELLAAELGCPRAVATVLAGRGFTTRAEAAAFLRPCIEDVLDADGADPMLMLGMPAAVERVLGAICASEPMLIYGDYDVDGTTATVLLKTAIERIGAAMEPARAVQVSYHVPHRIREGYGMQASVLADAAAAGIRLVISVDTGIRAVTEAAEARRLGLDLIVTDHHLPDGMTELPDAFAVVNPAQAGCGYANKHLCGAAVAFKLAQALLTAAAVEMGDAAGWKTRVRKKLLPSLLKLVAIATIADSVPLVGENRAIAALGLAGLANPVQPGLRALMQLAGVPVDRAPTAGAVGFRIAPRINAAGRMDVASDVVELFLTRDQQRAQELAEKLDRLNQERRDSEARALEMIDGVLQSLVDGDGEYPRECLVLDHPEWHRGVIGILASRVVERTNRPALVVTHAEGYAHGSGRSVPGFHLLDAITAADAADPAEPLFRRFGGHAHAVGFSLESGRLSILRERMREYSTRVLDASLLLRTVEYDAELGLEELSEDFVAWVARCAPFGVGNSEPVFLSRGVALAGGVRYIQEKHVCLPLVVPGKGGNANPSVPALGWSRGATDWVERCGQLELGQGTQVDLLYRVRRNTGPYASPHMGGLELELCDLRRTDRSAV